MEITGKRTTNREGARNAPRALPFTGRERELGTLRAVLREARQGHGSLVLVSGEAGVGKTRLARQAVSEARAEGWQVAAGQAYEVESGFPYGVIADALAPLVQSLDAQSLTVVARGTEADLARILPGLRVSRERAPDSDDAEAKTRMLWHFAQFVRRLATRQPLVITFDNLQWADAASLELLHFVGRQLADAPLVVIVTYIDDPADATSPLRRVLRSLQRQDGVCQLHLPPMDDAEVRTLVQHTFETTGSAVEEFAARLYEQTRGNVFFTEEVLIAMVDQGALRQVGSEWVGWGAQAIPMPVTVREAVRTRLETLSAGARAAANVMAVVGTPSPAQLLENLVDMAGDGLADALDELVRRGLAIHPSGAGEGLYELAHPIVRSVVYQELGVARARTAHGRVVQALERHYGATAAQHAAELARHLVHAEDLVPAERAIPYFVAAGHDALERHADRAADQFLTIALEKIDGAGGQDFAALLPAVLADLARARQRVGAHGEARAFLLRARDLAHAAGHRAGEATIERQLGLVALASGELTASLEHFAASESVARSGGLASLAVRARISRAMGLQTLGRSGEGRELVLQVIPEAEALNDAGLLARAHRAMVLLYSWTGPAAEARRHGALALTHARDSGDLGVAWSVHWALAILASFTGDGASVRSHLQEAERIATQLNSPVLQTWTAEIGIEYASVAGQWAQGLAMAERVIPVARVVAPRTLLPRLLVWMGIMLLERDEIDRAKALFDEAWHLAGGGRENGTEPDVNVVIPACIGMALYYNVLREHAQAVAWGTRALAIADKLGFASWAIHRLLPLLCEAYLFLEDFDRAAETARRMRELGEALDHRLGLASADAADALLMRFRDNRIDAHEHLLAAAEKLERIPFVFHAARLRRNGAQLLVADGRTEEAVRELRRAHDLFLQMGAERELRGTREELRSLGVRPPQRTIVTGGLLSPREQEIADLVVQRKSNKEIARALDISVRTVSTHLSNIFVKLGVDSRGALADAIRGH